MLINNIWDAPGEEVLAEKLLFDHDTTETVALGRVTVEPGKSTQTGFHEDEEEIYVILKGSALLSLGDEKKEVFPGDTVYVPRNTKHRMTCTSEGNLEYLYFANWPES